MPKVVVPKGKQLSQSVESSCKRYHHIKSPLNIFQSNFHIIDVQIGSDILCLTLQLWASPRPWPSRAQPPRSPMAVLPWLASSPLCSLSCPLAPQLQASWRSPLQLLDSPSYFSHSHPWSPSSRYVPFIHSYIAHVTHSITYLPKTQSFNVSVVNYAPYDCCTHWSVNVNEYFLVICRAPRPVQVVRSLEVSPLSQPQQSLPTAAWQCSDFWLYSWPRRSRAQLYSRLHQLSASELVITQDRNKVRCQSQCLEMILNWNSNRHIYCILS